MIRHLMLFAMSLFFTLLPAAASAYDTASPSNLLVIEHVTVIPMTENGASLPDRAVVIEDGRIVAIVPTDDLADIPEATRIDGSGKWLIPGLSDMHVHIGNDRLLRLLLNRSTPADGASAIEDFFLPFIANGVLQIFDLAAMSETVGQRIEIESGRVLGPHIAMAAMIDGADPIWPLGMTRIALTPEDGRQAVRDAAAESYRFVKVYSHVDLPTFTAIVEEARAQNMRVIGHIPQRGQDIAGSFFQPGFDLVVHAEELAQQTATPDETAIPAYVEMARRNDTWLIATLTVNERILEIARNPETLQSRDELHILSPAFYAFSVDHNPYAARAGENFASYARQIVQFNRPLVRAFADAGIPILTGTDAGAPGVAPGLSLHDEFEALAEAGLGSYSILEGSTRLPAEWLGVADDRGTVAVGMRADLVMLDANPLVDISNTRRISAVIRDGRYLSREDLNARMNELVQRNRQAREALANENADRE